MADSFKSSILLGVQLQSANEIQNKLNNIIKTLNNSKIDLDINIKNSDVAKQLETLTNLANNFKTSLGGNVSLGNINEVINKATSAMSNLNGEVLKVTTTRFNNGEIGKQVAEISTGIGTVVKQVQSLQDGTLVESAKTIITNNAKIKQSIDDIANAQQKLNQLEKNGFADKNKVADLQNMFSNSNNFSSDNELKKYLEQVKQLEVEESKLIQIQKEENDLVNQMANGREKAEQKSQQRDRTQELNQAKAVNKALEDEYKLQQQIKNSETNSLTKDINNTISQVEKLQQKFGNKLPNGFVESTTKDLNSLLSKLKETDNVNFNNIRNSLNTVKSSMEQTTNETKQLVNSLKETNNGGFFSGLSNFLSKVGIFYGVQQVVQEITSQLKDAVNYTIQMDKSMTNMQMITGKSKGEIVDIVNNYKQLGEQLHTTNAEMMKGMEEVTRAGFDGKEGEALMSASIMGSKLSGQTTAQVTEQLIAIKNAFNMTGEGMQNVVDMMSKMDNVSATSFAEIATAIQRTAFSAQEAGTPLSNLITYITTVSEKTRKSASTIGESFKTIYARYSNIKLGNIDEDGKTINDTEFAINDKLVA
jgi:hypothetical protein